MKLQYIKIYISLLIISAGIIYYFSVRYVSYPGEKEINAIYEAYRENIQKIEVRKKQWAFLMDEKWHYWANGKLLPEEMLNTKNKYHAYRFYKYPQKPEKITEENIKRIKDRSRKKTSKIPRNNSFLNSIYNGETYSSINKELESIHFLGRYIKIHKKLIPHMKEIEKEIIEAAVKDFQLIEFTDNLHAITCFNWRNIEDTAVRSYHSYGIAIDLVPKKIRGKTIYWGWTKYHNKQWYNIPFSKRWQIPETILNIFESYGFVWGGKWLFFDNMHFEYRPEILILAGKEVKNP